jgi:hypothetical protein
METIDVEEVNAKELEEIILDLMNGNDWSDMRSTARGIAKKKLYPWYIIKCSFTKITPNPEIVKMFN